MQIKLDKVRRIKFIISWNFVKGLWCFVLNNLFAERFFLEFTENGYGISTLVVIFFSLKSSPVSGEMIFPQR